MSKYIFVSAFLFVCFFQTVIFSVIGVFDLNMWAYQAKYVEIGDARQFDAVRAYGHPGGPIIDGTIAIHDTFKISYQNSIIIFLVVFDALISAFICLICYFLVPDNFWWISVLPFLGLNVLYENATPPSIVASLLIALLCLLTLYLYKNKEKISVKTLFVWSLLAGMVVATRFDVGAVSVFVFALLLKHVVSWKKMFYVSLGAFASFWFFDPFMWFMPLKHIGDLFSKIFYHYADFVPTHMSVFSVISISCFAFVSIALSLVLIFLREKIPQVLPTRFTLYLLAMTGVLYVVFLSARYQTPRYFLPIILIWEIFLPIIVFSLTSQKKIKIFVATVLFLFPFLFFCQSIWIDYVHHLLPWQN